MQADLLFKKHTGLSKSKHPVARPRTGAVASSFSRDEAKESKKEQLHGLNRMDFNTFVLAMSDIANQLYLSKQDTAEEVGKGES